MRCSQCAFKCVTHRDANEHEYDNPQHIVDYYFGGK